MCCQIAVTSVPSLEDKSDRSSRSSHPSSRAPELPIGMKPGDIGIADVDAESPERNRPAIVEFLQGVSGTATGQSEGTSAHSGIPGLIHESRPNPVGQQIGSARRTSNRLEVPPTVDELDAVEATNFDCIGPWQPLRDHVSRPRSACRVGKHLRIGRDKPQEFVRHRGQSSHMTRSPGHRNHFGENADLATG